MKSILVIGVGHFGRHIIDKLNDLGCQIMGVDIIEDNVNAIANKVDSAQIGNSTNEDFLRGLGVNNFDAAIVTIAEDFQSSLETVSLLKALGARHVVARAASEIQEKFLLRIGADEVVYPEKQLAAWTSIRCTSNYVFDYIDLGGEHAIYEVAVPEEWNGKTVEQLQVRRKYGMNLLGVRKDHVLNVNIRPDTVMDKDSTVLILGDSKNIMKYFYL